MAVGTIIAETSFSIEVANGLDSAGDTKYSKKTFGNVKNDADAQSIHDVSQAIKNVLSVETRETLINVVSSIANA